MSGEVPDEQAVTELVTTVCTALGAAQAISERMLEAMGQYEDMKTALAAVTGGLGYDAYEAMIKETLAKQNITDLNKAVNDINNGLIAIEQGQMTAAVEFANGKAVITLGEYQMELAQAQLDSAEEQINSGLDQMKDAGKQLEEGEKQLEEGEKQLADAKEDAYEKADMTDVLTADTVKKLLTAQNFSMPQGM